MADFKVHSEVTLVGILAATVRARELLLHVVLCGHMTTKIALVPETFRAERTEERVWLPSVYVVLVLPQGRFPRKRLATFLTLVSTATSSRTKRSQSVEPMPLQLQHNACMAFSEWNYPNFYTYIHINEIYDSCLVQSEHCYTAIQINSPQSIRLFSLKQS